MNSLLAIIVSLADASAIYPQVKDTTGRVHCGRVTGVRLEGGAQCYLVTMGGEEFACHAQ